MTDLLVDEISEKDAKKKLEAISRSVDRLVNVVNDAVDAANVVDGSLIVTLNTWFPKLSFTRLLKKYEQIAQFKQIDYVLSLDTSVPEKLFGDEWAIVRVCDVLVNNAFKFTTKGKIEINVSWIAKDKSNGVLSVIVSDTGRGMSQEEQGRIFDAYVQVDGSNTRTAEGLGIGLYLAKHLCFLLGGELVVASDKNVGSQFTIKVPLQSAKVDRKSSLDSQSKASTGKRLKFLIVEDDELAAEIVARQLDIYDVEIKEARNGKKAYEIYQQFKPDLVIMDMRMPVMDGYEATKLIREFEQQNNMPGCKIIAITADALRQDQKQTHAAGCDVHMNKPFRKSELYSVLEILEPNLQKR